MTFKIKCTYQLIVIQNQYFMKISFQENIKHINGLETSNKSKSVLYGNFVKYLHLVLCNRITNLLSNENA